jgi:hypothetical protein
MIQRPGLQAFIYGVIGGALIAGGGSYAASWAPWFRLHVLADLIWFGLSILVAPAAAAASATARGAAPPRVLSIAGLAFLLEFFVVNIVDYGLTVLLLAPDAPGPFQRRTEVSAGDVDTMVDRWLLMRHVVLCSVAVVGGAALGVWRGRAAS